MDSEIIRCQNCKFWKKSKSETSAYCLNLDAKKFLGNIPDPYLPFVTNHACVCQFFKERKED